MEITEKEIQEIQEKLKEQRDLIDEINDCFNKGYGRYLIPNKLVYKIRKVICQKNHELARLEYEINLLKKKKTKSINKKGKSK